MNEQVARNVVLVRAIETADGKREVLSEDDRRYASRSARELAQWQAAESKSAVTMDHFLEQRSEQVIKRLAERTPAFAAFARRRPMWRAVAIGLPLIGLLAGVGLDRISDPHRVDLLSAPLLAIIGWNLLVYLVLLVWAVLPSRRTGWAGEGLLRRLSVGKASLPRRLPGALAGGLAQFVDEWTRLSYPLSRARLSCAVHLAAAMFALGAIASLYARGLLTQYAAGWESTFLDATQVHALLSALFAPALAVLPVEGFSLADIEALHFTREPSAAGGARWVHLYAATLFLLVVLPRLLLSLLAGWRARRLRRRFPLDLNQPYFNTIATGIGAAGPAVVRVIPYSFTVDEARDRGLAALVQGALGEQARLMLRPSCPYGEDPKESLHDARLDDPAITVTAALFNLSATPEKENHGAFLDHLRRHTPRGLVVLVDESGLAERSGTQAGADARIAERAALWRQFCSYHGTDARIVNLLDPGRHPLDLGAGTASMEAR